MKFLLSRAKSWDFAPKEAAQLLAARQDKLYGGVQRSG
jgi:hypothetical protein